MCAILPVANACATLGRGVQAEQGAVTDGAGISQTIDRLGSVEARLANIEAQQNWLHLEQLRAEVAGLRKTIEYLIEYVAERDGAAVERINDVADFA